jgi:hypothetical protein
MTNRVNKFPKTIRSAASALRGHIWSPKITDVKLLHTEIGNRERLTFSIKKGQRNTPITTNYAITFSNANGKVKVHSVVAKETDVDGKKRESTIGPSNIPDILRLRSKIPRESIGVAFGVDPERINLPKGFSKEQIAMIKPALTQASLMALVPQKL